MMYTRDTLKACEGKTAQRLFMTAVMRIYAVSAMTGDILYCQITAEL